MAPVGGRPEIKGSGGQRAGYVELIFSGRCFCSLSGALYCHVSSLRTEIHTKEK